jgi:hypothetical protein
MNELRFKVDEFVGLVEDEDWMPKMPNPSHNSYVESLV